MWKLILLIVAAAAVYLVGNARTQLFDRDEPRYAQCSRQMLESGDWVVPRLYDKIRAAKPPGIYWCQATMMKLLGDTAFAARLPSALAAVLTLVLLAVALSREVGSQRTIWTLFIFATSALTIISAKVCLTDSVLLLWTSVALVCMYLLWQGRGGWPAAIILSIAIGAGGLIKGPFILGVLAGTLCMLGLFASFDWWRRKRTRHAEPDEILPGSLSAGAERRVEPGAAVALAYEPAVKSSIQKPFAAGLLRFGVGFIIVVAMVTPWLLMVHHREPHFLLASTQDAMEHLERGAEGHSAPPGYHLALIWFTFLPWSLLLPLAIGLGFRHRHEPPVRFALAVALGTWAFVEFFVGTKLPHYMLAAFPALAFLTAAAALRCLEGEYRDLQSKQLRAGTIVWAVAVLGLATVPWWYLAIRFRDYAWFPLIALTVFGIGYASIVSLAIWRGRPRNALVAMGIGAWVLAALLFGLYLPRSTPLRLSIRVADLLKAHDVVHPGQVMMLDYKEPSLAFYQGGTIREAKHSLPTVMHIDTAPPWMVMTRQIWEQTTPAVRRRLGVVGQPMKGIAYSDGLRTAELMVVRKIHAPDQK